MSKTFVLISRNNYQGIDITKLLYCIGHGSYTTLFFEDQKNIVLAKLIKEVEQVLENNSFLRISNNCLVNSNYIKNYCLGKEAKVILLNNVELTISRRKREKIKRILHSLFSHI